MTFSKERLEELKKLVETTNIVDLYPREQKFMQAAALLPQYIEALEEARKALEWYVENDDTNIGQEGNGYWEAGLERGKQALSTIHTLSQPQREGSE